MTFFKVRSLRNFVPEICTVVATVLLTLSIGFTPSTFKPVPSKDGRTTDLCFNGKLLAVGFGGNIAVSTELCPGWDKAKPVALIAVEHQSFVYLGFLVLVFGLGWDRYTRHKTFHPESSACESSPYPVTSTAFSA